MMDSPTGIDRRKFKRLDVALDVAVSIEADAGETGLPERLEGICRNLSMRGLCLETPQLAHGAVKLVSGPAGARDYTLALELYLTEQEEPLKLRGEVCWYNVDHSSLNFTYLVGVKFVGLSSAERKTLKKFLQSRGSSPGLIESVKSFFSSR